MTAPLALAVLVAALSGRAGAQRMPEAQIVEPSFVNASGALGGDSDLVLVGGRFRVFCGEGRVVVQLVSRAGGPRAAAESLDEPRLASGCNLEIRLPDPTAVPEALEPLPGIVNLIRGQAPAASRTGLGRHASVEYHDVVPGVDLRLSPARDGLRLELTNWAKEAASVDLDFVGDTLVSGSSNHGLELLTAAGPLELGLEDSADESALVAAADRPAARILSSSGTTTLALTTVPDLYYGSFFGGADADEAYGVATHWPGSGATRTFVCGRTTSATFYPAFPSGSFDVTHNGAFDAFVFKLNGVGNALVYATYIGGSQDDVALDIVTDESGVAFVSGLTYSSVADGFPSTTGAFDTSYGGLGDAFALQLDASGSALGFCTYLGGREQDIGYAIARGSGGDVYVAGQTSSLDYPLSGPPAWNDVMNHNAAATTSDGFVTRLDPTGSSLVYSTYIVGLQSDACVDLALDAAGGAHVVGNTNSIKIAAPPLWAIPGFAPGGTGGSDSGFLVSLNPAGNTVLLRTFIEGSSGDTGNGVAVDANGAIYVTGYTESTNFPVTTGSYDTSANGSTDVYLVQVSASTGNLLYGTYLGGSGEEEGQKLCLTSSGLVALTGFTASSNFPVTSGAFDTSANGQRDAFLSFLDLSLSGSATLVGSTFLGGRYDDESYAAVYDAHGNLVHCAGLTESTAFPTTLGALSSGYAGGTDAFVARLTVP